MKRTLIHAAAILLTAITVDSGEPIPGHVAASETNLQWTAIWSRDAGAAKAESDAQIRRDAGASTRIEHTGSRDWSVTPEVRLDVSAGDLVEAAAWVRIMGNGSAGVSFVLRTKDGHVAEWTAGDRIAAGDAEWTRLRSRIVVPEDIATVAPRITGAGPSIVWMEGLRFRRFKRTSTAGDAPVNVRNDKIQVALDPATANLSVTDLRTGVSWAPLVDARGTAIASDLRTEGRAILATLTDLVRDLEICIRIEVDPLRPEAIVSLVGDGLLDAPFAWPPPFATGSGQRWLAPDGSVQQSTFAGGTVVTVNFGDRPHRLPDGRVLAPVSSDVRIETTPH